CFMVHYSVTISADDGRSGRDGGGCHAGPRPGRTRPCYSRNRPLSRASGSPASPRRSTGAVSPGRPTRPALRTIDQPNRTRGPAKNNRLTHLLAEMDKGDTKKIAAARTTVTDAPRYALGRAPTAEEVEQVLSGGF